MAELTTAERVRNVIADHLALENPPRNIDGLVDDLGADSFDTVEIVIALEEEFDTAFDFESEIDAETSVADVIALVEDRLHG